MNKRGAMNFGILVKLVAVLLLLIGLVNYELVGLGAFIGLGLTGLIANIIIKWALAITGVYMLFKSFNTYLLGKRWLGILAGFILGGFGVYLIAVEYNYLNQLITVNEITLGIASVIYGVYLFIQSYL